LDHARADSLKVIPDCSYAAAFIRRHTQYADLLAG
jgi:predicted GNAT family acetyltransferase